MSPPLLNTLAMRKFSAFMLNSSYQLFGTGEIRESIT
jgi:hypothetical protein